MPGTGDRAEPLPRRTQQALLRRLRTSDLAAFQAYRHDAELGRYQGWSVQSEDEALVFLDEMNRIALLQPGQWTQIAIADPATDQLLGDIGLFIADDQRLAEIGFTLARAAQGAGVATAAVCAAIELVFELTPVAKIIGVTDARNGASIRLLERVGMQHVESRCVMFNGEDCVEWVFSRAR